MKTLLDQALAALQSIEMRASCAPNDDAEVAGREFTRIMLTARAAKSNIAISVAAQQQPPLEARVIALLRPMFAQPDKWGYHAAHTALNDEWRATAKTLFDELTKVLA